MQFPFSLPRTARAGLVVLVAALLAVTPGIVSAQPQAATQPGMSSDSTAIRTVLLDQTAAWNRGDIEGFMHGYKNSLETTFISKQVEHGYQAVLSRYRQKYTSREAMGALDFSHLNIRMLCADYAMVTGQFHLQRKAAGGGDASGVFSLLFQKTPDGWKILLDHTS